jgi:phosphonate transport system substrate-binding protein
MKKIVLFLILLICTFVFIACDQTDLSTTESISSSSNSTEITPESLKMYVVVFNVNNFAVHEAEFEAMVSEMLGINLDVIATSDSTIFLEAISNGQADMAIVEPRYYLDVYLMNKMKTILTSMHYDVDEYGLKMEDSPLIKGNRTMIIVKKDSGINQISDLIGKRIAIISYSSTSTWLWQANLLLDHGVNPLEDITVVISRSHYHLIEDLLKSNADAAFIYKDDRTFAVNDYPYVFNETKVLAETPLLPVDIMLVNKRISQTQIDSIQQAFITLSQDEDFVLLCEELFYNQGFGTASDEDFVQLRLYIQRINEHLLVN